MPKRTGRSPVSGTRKWKHERLDDDFTDASGSQEYTIIQAEQDQVYGDDVPYTVRKVGKDGNNEQVVLEESEVCESLAVAQEEEEDIAPELLIEVGQQDGGEEEGGYDEEQNLMIKAQPEDDDEEDEDGDGMEETQSIIIQHMDISEPMSTLRQLLQMQSPVSLDKHEFWLRDLTRLDPSKSLASQCIQASGLVQVNIEIKNGGPQPTINIVDILKAADELPESIRRIHKPYKQRPKKCVMKIAGDPSADTQDNNIARWVVDQQFREAMEQLDIPKDPMMWSVEHVRYWLQWATEHFSLEGLDIDNVQLVGTDLYNLTLEDFTRLFPNDVDNVFWTHLELLRKCKFVAVNQPSGSYAEGSANRRFSGVQGRGNRSGNNGQIQLWQFLLELLTDPGCNDLIQWVGEDGEFKLNNHEGVAKMWGQRKNKPNMNYEKLSRALRYYYDGDMIAKVSGKRFTYKFICDLKALIGFTPSDIQRLVDSPTVHIEHVLDDGLDSDRVRLEHLRESLRVPGIVKRSSVYAAVEPELETLIIDGTS